MDINSTSKDTYDFIVLNKNKSTLNNRIYKNVEFEFIREQDDVIVDMNNDEIDLSSLFDIENGFDEDDELSINNNSGYDTVYVDSQLKERLDKFNRNTLDTLSYLSILNKIKSGKPISDQDVSRYNNLVTETNIDIEAINEHNEKDELFLGFNPEF